jgi:hypothetical protein
LTNPNITSVNITASNITSQNHTINNLTTSNPANIKVSALNPNITAVCVNGTVWDNDLSSCSCPPENPYTNRTTLKCGPCPKDTHYDPVQ